MMKATLFIERVGENDSFTERMILEVLGSSGVHEGVNKTLIAEMVENQWFDTEFTVAEGQDPVHGENGRVEYMFDPDPKIHPTVLPDGSVDYASINILQKVHVGDILAKLYPPTQGIPGFDISGNMLPAIPGKPTNLARGQRTSYADAGATILRSDVNGHVRLNKDRVIEVATVYEVKGDVNYTVGNIDFEGDVIVRGDVLSGFKITATGEVEVGGVVEDAEISAGGSVLVRAGFIGSGKGFIHAEVNAAVRYVHHQTITAGNDIVISSEAMDATLIAGRSISIKGGPGVLVGGLATAGYHIDCNALGNERHTRTEALITWTSNEGRRLEETKDLLRTLEGQAKKVQTTLDRMEEIDQFVQQVTPQRGALYETLYATRNDLEEKLVAAHQTLTELEQKLKDELAKLYIRVNKAVYPGVNIGIAGSRLGIYEREGKTMFKLIDGEVSPAEFK